VHILVATDAQWVLDDVMAALSSPSTSFTVVTNGREVVKAVKERTPDLAILDLQVGTMVAWQSLWTYVLTTAVEHCHMFRC